MGKKIDDVKQFLENNGINAYRKFDDGLVYKDKHNGHIYSIYYELLDEHLDNNCSIILGDVSSNIQNKITILRKINDINKDNFIYNIYISDDNCLVILFSYMCPVEFFDAESFLQYTVDHINNLKKKDFFGLTQYIDNVSNNNINDTSKNVNNNNNGYMINFKRNWTYSSLVEDLHNTSDRLKEDLNEALEINDKQKKLETLKKLQEHYNSAEINDLFLSRAHEWMYDNNPSHNECMIINNYINSYHYALIDIADSIRYLSNEEVDNDEDDDDEYDEYEDDDDEYDDYDDYYDESETVTQPVPPAQPVKQPLNNNTDSKETIDSLLNDDIFVDAKGNSLSAIHDSNMFLERMCERTKIYALTYKNSVEVERKSDELFENESWEEIINFCTKHIASMPMDDGLYNLRGIAKHKLNYPPQDIIKDYAIAIKLNPMSPNLYGNLAIQYDRLGSNKLTLKALLAKRAKGGTFADYEEELFETCNAEKQRQKYNTSSSSIIEMMIKLGFTALLMIVVGLVIINIIYFSFLRD